MSEFPVQMLSLMAAVVILAVLGFTLNRWHRGSHLIFLCRFAFVGICIGFTAGEAALAYFDDFQGWILRSTFVPNPFQRFVFVVFTNEDVVYAPLAGMAVGLGLAVCLWYLRHHKHPSTLSHLARAVPMSIWFAVPLLVVFCTVLPICGLSNMHGTTWDYGQPLPFLTFYGNDGWELYFREWRFRVAVDIVFWFLAFAGGALACAACQQRFGEQFSARKAFFGFVFGTGICLAAVVCPFVHSFCIRLDISLAPACDPVMIVQTFFGHAFGFDHSLSMIAATLILFGCAVPGSLLFARGVRVYRPWSGSAIAIGALACFSFVIASRFYNL